MTDTNEKARDALDNPQIGDLWSERLNYFLTVAGVNRTHVVVLKDKIPDGNKFIWDTEKLTLLTRREFRKMFMNERNGYISGDVDIGACATDIERVDQKGVDYLLKFAYELNDGSTMLDLEQMKFVSEHLPDNRPIRNGRHYERGDVYFENEADAPELIILDTRGSRVAYVAHFKYDESGNQRWHSEVCFIEVCTTDEMDKRLSRGQYHAFKGIQKDWVDANYDEVTIERGYIRDRLKGEIAKSGRGYPLDMAEALDHEYQQLVQPEFMREPKAKDEWIGWDTTQTEGHALLLGIIKKMDDVHFAVMTESYRKYPNSDNLVREWDTTQIRFMKASEIRHYLANFAHRRVVAFRGHSGMYEDLKKINMAALEAQFNTWLMGTTIEEQPPTLVEAKAMVIQAAKFRADNTFNPEERHRLRMAIRRIEGAQVRD